MFELQRERLSSFEDGLDDIWREEGTGKDVPDLVRCESGLPGQRSHVSDSAFKDFFVPGVPARNRLYQCRPGVSDGRVRVWRNHQMNFPAVPFPLRFDGQTK